MHQQRATLPTEPGAGGECDPLFLGGQRYRADLRIGLDQLDEARMPGIGNITDLADIGRLQRGKYLVTPVGCGFGHGGSEIALRRR